MKIRRSLLATSVAATLVLAACGNGSGDDSDSGDADTGTEENGGGEAAEEGQYGGTLKILANGDLDRLDPQYGAYVPTSGAQRALSRQLISYETVEDEETRIVAQGDLATEAPEPSEDGLTYTFTIREGAMWDAPDGPRQITPDDFENGLKRACTPYLSSALLTYFTSLIEGMDEFCSNFQDVEPEVEPMKEYMLDNDISGVVTEEGSLTFDIVLTEPAGDFLYMLSLNGASPAPVEYFDYLPDSPELHENYISSAPYTVDTYTPDSSLVLKRNEAWDAEADPLRKAYVDSIEMTMGVQPDAAIQQLQAGSADMLFDIVPTPAQQQQMNATNDEKLMVIPTGGVDPYLWFNTKTDNNDGALQDVKVRQALQYAVDKAAVVQTLGGEGISQPIHGIFGTGIIGQKDFNLYPTDGDAGDPEKTKELLAEAGYPDGLTLIMPYRTIEPQPAIAQTIQASFEAAGVTIELKPIPPTDYYANFMTNHENAVNGEWDIAPVGWSPDWQGGAARSVFQPQFTFDGTPQTYNYVDYNNDEANELAAQALAASDPDEAAELWHQVDQKVMEDSIILPIAVRSGVVYRSERVQNFIPYTLSANGDWTHVWLED